MFCSTIIPTINRSTLDRAVRSALDQNFAADEFEIIVVNDSGQPLLSADWHSSDRVTVLNTDRRERSVARNTGAAIARGRYLNFLDDDDYLLPGAYQNLRALAEAQPEAGWLYGGSQITNRDGSAILQLHHHLQGNCFTPVMAGEWIPLQSSMIRAEKFFAAGLFTYWLAGGEDVDLLRRIALRCDLAETQALIACIAVGENGSTTDARQGRVESLAAREQILDQAGCFKRLAASAKSGFWHGRLVRAYLTSTIWNLRHRFLFKASSRLARTAIAGISGSRYILSAHYWRAITRAYQSPAFHLELAASDNSQTGEGITTL